MKKRMFATVLTVLLALSLTACGGAPSPGASTDPAPANPTSAADPSATDLGVDEIVIGYVGAITGPSAALGAPVHEITKYAVDELNENGGICGVPVRYVYRDDQGDPTKATTYVQELVYKEGVNLMLGPVNSTCVSANLDFLTENEIVTFLCSASATELVDPEAYPYMFRTTVVNNFMAEGLVLSALKGGYENIVLLADNTTTGSDGMTYLKKYAEQNGMPYAAAVEYTAGAVDMTPVAQQIASAGADCIVSFALGADAAKIVGALDRLDMTGKYDFLSYMGGVVPNFAELAGDVATDNVFYQGLKCGSVVDGDEAPNLGYSQAWYDRVSDTFGEYRIDGSGRTWGWIEAGRAYDCIQIMKAVIEQTGSLDADALKEAIENTGTFDSVLYETGYSFGVGDHEGFDPNELANCYMGRYVQDIGDLRGEPITVRNPKFD